MAIKLKCPNCRERLFAEEADRGRFVKCAGCDTRVPVPADGGSPPASGTTKVPPAAPVAKTAPVVPVLKPTPAKAVVNAEVVATAPVKPKTATAIAIPTVAPLPAPAKPKRRADEEDDDLDDRPRRRADEEDEDDTPPAKGGKGLLYVILGVGVLLLAGIGVGLYFLLQDDTPTEPGAYFAKKPNGMPDDWEAFDGEGVSCHVPSGDKKQTPTQINGFDGTWLTSTDAKTGVSVDVITLHLGVDPEPKSEETVRFAFGYLDPLFVAPKSTASGRVVDEITPPTGGPNDLIWYHTTGDKAHVLRLRQTAAQPSELAVALRDHFFTKAEFSGTVRPNARETFNRLVASRNPKGGEPPERAWQVFAAPAASGFSVQAPGGAGMTAEPAKFRPTGAGFGREIEGKVYEVADGIFTYRVFHVDLPDGHELNPQEYIKQARKSVESFELDPTVTEDLTVNGLPARRWRIRGLSSRCNACCLTVAHEGRLYILTAFVKDGGGNIAREPALLARAKKFFASLKVTFDPKNYDPTAGQPAWVPMPDAVGFAAVAPPGVAKRPFSQPFGQGRELFERAVGFEYSVSDPDVKYQVVRVSLAVGRDPTAVAAALLPEGGKVLSGPTPVTVKGIAGQDSTRTDRSDHLVRARTFATGNVAMVATVTATRNSTHPDRLLQFKADKFFAGLTVDAVAAPPPAETEWVDVPTPLGFAAKGPKGTTVGDFRSFADITGPVGKKYEMEDEVAKYSVHVLPLGPKSNPVKAVEDASRGGAFDKVLEGPRKVRHDGLEGEETVLAGFGGEKVRRRVFLTPVVLYVLRVDTKRNEPDAEAVRRADKFFASFKFTAGAVAPGGTVNVGNGEFASAGKVQPFWAAVLLPGKKELLALGARNPADLNPGGILRRYSYPDFKLKATYHLPLPVNRAAADEKSGRLICSVISKYRPTLDQREAVSWTADLQLFDLNKIVDGSLAEAEEIKPLKRLTVNQPISGLEADPLGGYAYAAVVVLPPPVKGRPPLPASGRLYRIDLAKDDFFGNPINHREPLDGLRLSATGKALVTSETAVAAPPPGKLFNLVVVNAPAWKIDKLIPVSAPAKDLTFTGEDVVALVPTGNQNKVYALAAASNEVVDVTPKNLSLEGFGYLRATADGKRALGSAGLKQNGLLLANVTDSGEKVKFEKVTSGTTVATAPTGGHFVLTPDGKYAVFNTGAVVDLTKTTAAPKE